MHIMSDNRKGGQVKVIRGSREGKKGWYDVSKRSRPAQSDHLILLNRDGTEDICTLCKLSIEAILLHNPPPPASFQEAMLQQHPNIERMMNKLATALAKFEGLENTQELGQLFLVKVREAQIKQAELGCNELWRHVHWTEPADC